MDKYFEEIKEITLNIFNNPELGYEEWHTKKILMDYVKKNWKVLNSMNLQEPVFPFLCRINLRILRCVLFQN